MLLYTYVLICFRGKIIFIYFFRTAFVLFVLLVFSTETDPDFCFIIPVYNQADAVKSAIKKGVSNYLPQANYETRVLLEDVRIK